MAVSYKRLFHLLKERVFSNVQIRQETYISANILTRLKRNEYISLESI